MDNSPGNEGTVAFDFSSIPNMLDKDEKSNAAAIAAAQKLTKKQKARNKVRQSKGDASIQQGLLLKSMLTTINFMSLRFSNFPVWGLPRAPA